MNLEAVSVLMISWLFLCGILMLFVKPPKENELTKDTHFHY